MGSFIIQTAAKFKMVICRLSKLHDTIHVIVHCDKMTIVFENGVVELLNSIGASPEYGAHIESFAFDCSTIKLNKLLKNITSGQSLLCRLESESAKNKLVVVLLSDSNKMPLRRLKLSIFPSPPKEPIHTAHGFEFCVLRGNVLPGRLSLHEIIWNLEKIAHIFEVTNLNFKSNTLSIEAHEESYCVSSELQLINPSVHDLSVTLKSESLLSLMWLLEYISDSAYLFVHPKTLNLCLANFSEDSNCFVVIS